MKPFRFTEPRAVAYRVPVWTGTVLVVGDLDDDGAEIDSSDVGYGAPAVALRDGLG